MFKIVNKITAENLIGSEELESWLDDKFYVNPKLPDGRFERNFDDTNEIVLESYAAMVTEKCPEALGKSLYWIRNYSNYSNPNHVGKLSYYHIWPLFFRKFPLGEIWIIESPKNWAKKIMEDRNELGIKYDYDKINPNGFPQEMTGLQTDFFPQNALSILSYGIYPLISCTFFLTGIKTDLTFLYMPDRSFKHSQMTESDTLYTRILGDFHHLFDDQWTFDSSRGPKSAIDEVILNPVKQLDYFQWFIDIIDKRMEDVISIKDILLREKLVMTVNRAIADAILSVTSELPYMSMVFFFSLLDKLANIMHLLKIKNSEHNAWLNFVNKDYLASEVLNTLKNVPNKSGEHLTNIVKLVIEELEYGDLSPENLRDIRNTHHGYNLTQQGSIDRLMTKNGELNNDIPLLATPLIIYLFTLSWKV